MSGASMPGVGTWALCRRLFGLMRQQRRWMLLGLALAVLSALSGIGLLAVSGHFITSMALVGAGGAAINYYTPAALIRLFAIVRTGGRYAERLVTHEATLRMLARLRVWLFGRLVPLAPAALGELRSAELFSRLRSDVDALEHAYLGVLIPLLGALVVVLVVVVVSALYLPALGLPLLLFFLFGAVWLPRWALRRGRAPGEIVVACDEAMRELVSDGLRGRAELALYGAEDAHAAQMTAVAARQRKAQRQLDRLQALGSASVLLTAQLAAVCSLILGLSALRGGGLGGPDLVMLVLLVPAAFEAVTPLPEAWAQLGATLASARRVFDLADTPVPVPDPVASSPTIHQHDLCLRAVRLRYADNGPWALDGVDLDLPQGRRIALVGASGAGKSSLVAALTRLYPCTGSITLGGTPLHAWRGDDLLAQIAVVEQRPYLFDASLRDNLCLARPEASEAELERVIQLAQLGGYVVALPQGLRTWVGEDGVRVSGGEARRIAIARALLVDPPILVLDEPTEGLDAGTVAQLYTALDAAMHGRSVLLVTHRLGHLAQLVDEVATMRDGRIVACVAVASYLAQQSSQALHAPPAVDGRTRVPIRDVRL
ncbi:MAG: thiol reductant ABC exporter subunit CydC [Rhodanobacter sp.]|nr:MAG: thiol reductant ABC exporter subunit CydC [Rhodanobacter sp.]TAM00464.1 MAG: thiol reductant ABC exporter subunit CydC [Rhodanobacter sp.]TAM39188.1 MAG: thiol reductant ABC exporter subunit CydC [Rhodanobacter sp.]TAN27994.1 MAG: thiol reductant ABC exporter subunit CydC [Rhodanobacter sp.]